MLQMLSSYEQLPSVFTEIWGIPVTIETKTEALRAGVQYNTHYLGRNFEDMGYKRETLFDIVGCKLPDAHNDHKKTGAAAAAAGGRGAAGGVAASSSGGSRGRNSGASSSSSSGGGAGASNAPAAAATAASSSGSKKKKKAQPGQVPPTQQTQPRRAQDMVHFQDTDDGFVVSFGCGPPGQHQGPVREVHHTLTQHVRQRGGEQVWGQVLGAVSRGCVTEGEVQQLSEMVRGL
jgi:hypothetical protein